MRDVHCGDDVDDQYVRSAVRRRRVEDSDVVRRVPRDRDAVDDRQPPRPADNCR